MTTLNVPSPARRLFEGAAVFVLCLGAGVGARAAEPAAALGVTAQSPAAAQPSTAAIPRPDMLEFTTADGKIQRRVLPRQLPPRLPIPTPGQPASAPPPEPEAVREARLTIAAAKDRETARVAAGTPPPPLTTEFESALRIVNDYSREQSRTRAREALERTNAMLAQTDLAPEIRESLTKSRDLLMQVLGTN